MRALKMMDVLRGMSALPLPGLAELWEQARAVHRAALLEIAGPEAEQVAIILATAFVSPFVSPASSLPAIPASPAPAPLVPALQPPAPGSPVPVLQPPAPVSLAPASPVPALQPPASPAPVLQVPASQAPVFQSSASPAPVLQSSALQPPALQRLQCFSLWRLQFQGLPLRRLPLLQERQRFQAPPPGPPLLTQFWECLESIP